MRKIILLLIPFVLIISCQKIETYTYVEYNENQGSFGITKKEESFEAESDSVAIIKAFQYFTIAEKQYNESENRISAKPIKYAVFKKNKVGITNLNFQKKDSILNSIREKIFNDSDIVKTVEKGFDTIAYNKLITNFNIKEEEFSSPKKNWIQPKSKPKYIDTNWIYSYFQENADRQVSNLRLVIQYGADDWLFIQKIQMLIDDNLFEISASEVKRDHNAGKIWEWTDIRMDSELKTALESAKSIKIKFTGQNYSKERILSQKEITSLNETVSLYNVMKGL